jgi:hypothetical protein
MRFALPYPISANDYWRKDKKGNIHVTSEAKLYQELVRMLVGGLVPITSTYAMHAEIYRPRNAGDLGNREKVLSDVLRGLAFQDDRDAVRILLTRHQADDEFGWVALEISEHSGASPVMRHLLEEMPGPKRLIFEHARKQMKAAGSERRNAQKRKAAVNALPPRARTPAGLNVTASLFRRKS